MGQVTKHAERWHVERWTKMLPMHVTLKAGVNKVCVQEPSPHTPIQNLREYLPRDHAQLFCINDCIWYPIHKSLEPEFPVHRFTVDGLCSPRKAASKIEQFYQIIHFITFLLTYSLWGFPWIQHAYEFFSEEYRRRFGVTFNLCRIIVNRGEWLWNPANMKGANKDSRFMLERKKR